MKNLYCYLTFIRTETHYTLHYGHLLWPGKKEQQKEEKILNPIHYWMSIILMMKVKQNKKPKQTYKTNGSDDDNSGRGKWNQPKRLWCLLFFFFFAERIRNEMKLILIKLNIFLFLLWFLSFLVVWKCQTEGKNK